MEPCDLIEVEARLRLHYVTVCLRAEIHRRADQRGLQNQAEEDAGQLAITLRLFGVASITGARTAAGEAIEDWRAGL